MADKKDKTPAVINFDKLLVTASELFKEQALLAEDESADLLKVETIKARANACLDAVSNAIELTHLADLVRSTDKEFRRDQELRVLNPMLRSVEKAALVVEGHMASLSAKLSQANGLDPDELAGLQAAYGQSIDNLAKLISSTSKLLDMQRKTSGFGGAGSRNSVAFIKTLENKTSEGEEKIKPRPLSIAEMKALTKTDRNLTQT